MKLYVKIGEAEEEWRLQINGQRQEGFPMNVASLEGEGWYAVWGWDTQLPTVTSWV